MTSAFRIFNIVVALVVTGCFGSRGVFEADAPRGCPLVIAHRAGGQEVDLPDNSKGAIDSGLADQLDIMEVDVRWSVEGKPFLFHDRRLSQSSWEVPSALVGVEFSSLPDRTLKSICTASRVECLLPLETALDQFVNSTAKLQLDLKDPRDAREVAGVVSEIDRRGLRQRVIIFCDPISECEAVRALSKSVHIMARVHGEQDVSKLSQVFPWAVQVDEALLYDPKVEDLRRRGVHIMVKTLDPGGDTPERWMELFRKGANMLLTDRPRAARDFLCSTSKG